MLDRVKFLSVLPSFIVAGALLALSGCATRAPMAEVTPASTALDAAKSAATANAGATTTKATQLQKFLWVLSPYRPDIQQGNFISQEMLALLKVGQTRDQVKFLLGTPLLQDIFHADRWDYPFYLARGNGELTSSRVTVYFGKDGKVEKFDGGNLPTEREYIERIAGKSTVQAPDKKKEEVGSASVSISK